MRKLLALVLILSVAFGVVVISAPTTVDFYTEDSATTGAALNATNYGRGQSFDCDASVTLDSISFYLCTYEDPGPISGNAYVKVYSHSGTYGSSSIGADSLCISDAVDVTTLSSYPTYALQTFTFSGGNRISLTDNYYVALIYFDGGGSGEEIYVGADGEGVHEGNFATFSSAREWTYDAAYDAVFYVYADDGGETGDTCCSSSSPLAFGSVDTSSTKTDSFYIYNCGDSALVDSIDWTNLDEAFTPLSDSAYNIASGVTTYFSIQFDPPDVASYADTIVLGHDSCGSIILSGTGVEPTEYPSGSNIFYLAPPHPASGLRAGNDGYAGTHPDTAWATINYAVDQLSAGDTLFIMGGIYSNVQHVPYTDSIYGSEGSPIVFKAYGDSVAVFTTNGDSQDRTYIWMHSSLGGMQGHAVFDGFGHVDSTQYMWKFLWDNNGKALFHIIGTSGSYVDDVVIKGIYNDGLDADTMDAEFAGGIYIAYGSNIEISDCLLRYVYWPTGIEGGDGSNNSQGEGDAIYLGSYSNCIKIEDNTIYASNHAAIDIADFGAVGYCYYVTAKGNYIPYNWGGGIYIAAMSHHCLIDSNRISNTGVTTSFVKAGVQVSGPDNVVRNNAIYSPNSYGAEIGAHHFGVYDYVCSRSLIYNNTFFECGAEHDSTWYFAMVMNVSGTNGNAIENTRVYNNIFYKSGGHDYDACNNDLYAELGLYTYTSSDEHNWLDPDAESSRPWSTGWGGNKFVSNVFRHNDEGLGYDTMIVWSRDSDYGGGCFVYGIDTLLTKDGGDTTWADCIGDDPLLASESPNSYGPTWYYLQGSSPCIDAGTVVNDTIGTYVESQATGYGWDTLVWYGTAPDIGAYEVEDTGDTCCSRSPTAYSFGSLDTANTSNHNFIISNCGDSTLYLDIGLVDSTEYNIQSGGGLDTLATTEACTVTVQFSPTSGGPKLDTLETGNGDCADVPISGTGFYAADCSLSVASIAFGTVTVDATSDETLMVYNTGTSPADTLEITISETCDTFSVVSGSGAQSILSGDSLAVIVRFSPTAAYIHACTLQTGCDSCGTIAMSGTGQARASTTTGTHWRIKNRSLRTILRIRNRR